MGIFSTLFGSGKSTPPPEPEADVDIDAERKFLKGYIGGWPLRIESPEERARLQLRWTRALKCAEKLVRKSPKSAAARIALAHLQHMDVPMAGARCHQLLTQVLKDEPQNGEAHYYMAAFLVTVDHDASALAEKHFLQAMELLQTRVDPDALQGLGFACLYQNKLPEAIAWFEKYLQVVGTASPVSEFLAQLKAGKKPQVIFVPPPGQK